MSVSASIVLYKNNPAIVRQTVESFLKCKLKKKLYLIDNSPTDQLKSLADNLSDVEYHKMSANLGFGRAHNVAIKKSIEAGFTYHVVLNPDIVFGEGTIEKLFAFMEDNPGAGMVSPKIVYPNGDLQPLCKLLPTPADLFVRRFLGSTSLAKRMTRAYELHDSQYNKVMNIPYLSGCFMFLRCETLKKVGLFDERIFMYIEDADLTRRIYTQSKALFYPDVVVQHAYEKGSYKNMRLMLYNIHGALIYFSKYGWFWDPERRRINRKVKKDYL